MPLHLQPGLAHRPASELAAELRQIMARGFNWNDAYRQYLYSRAMAILRAPNGVSRGDEDAAEDALASLAREGARWSNNPLPAFFLNSMNNNSGSNRYYNSNSNNNSPPPAAVRAPNYSKASGAVKKWLSARPHTVHQNVVKIKLPANAMDPISYTNFKAGNEAVMAIKKRLQKNGAMRSKRTFYNKNTIERLAGGKKWRTILRMKGPEVVFKDPINRRNVYRRDIMNVKFLG